MIDQSSRTQAATVKRIAADSSLYALQVALEEALKTTDISQVEPLTKLIGLVLGDISRLDSIATKHIHVVRGAPERSVYKGTRYMEQLNVGCKPEDCESCFWKFMCESETSYELGKRADALVRDFERIQRQTDQVKNVEDLKPTFSNAEFYKVMKRTELTLDGKAIPESLLTPQELSEQKQKRRKFVNGVCVD